MALGFPLCSRSAHDQNVLGGRPHCESPRPALKNWPPEKWSGVLSEGLPTPSNASAGKLTRLLRHSLMAQPAERGEALTVTDFQAVCHRSFFIFFLGEPVLSSDGPVSLQLRAPSHPPTPGAPRAPFSRGEGLLLLFFPYSSSTLSLRVRVGLLRLRASNEGLLRPRVARARERTNPQARPLLRALREHEGRPGCQLVPSLVSELSTDRTNPVDGTVCAAVR